MFASFALASLATFEYQAKTSAGEPRAGVIEAFSQEGALDFLHKEGLVVTALAEKRAALWRFRIKGRVRQKDIVIFSRQLSTLFEAQIPVVEALRTLAAEQSRSTLSAAITQMMNDVSAGASLSQAMAKHPAIFSDFYINLIRSGEETGKLQEIFGYLADYLERSYAIASKARNSMIYPAFVFSAFLGVMVVMLVVVIPRLVSIFEETGQEVPFYTQIIIVLSRALQQWGIAILIVLIIGAVALWRWGLTRAGRRFFHRLQLNIPIIGELWRKLYVARMADNLRTMIAGGIPLLRALEITGDVVGNTVYKDAINEAIESVKGGGSISAVFARKKEIPGLVSQMIRIGESSGRLDFILGNIAKFYQRDVDGLLDNLVSLVEPALIIMLGAGVGIMVAAVLVPLYNLAGSI